MGADMGDLRFHWCSPPDTGQAKPTSKYQIGRLDMGEVIDFVQEAEELGVDSLLFGVGHYLPDQIPVIGALSQVTERVTFLLAYRPGPISPTLFTQIVNTLSWMTDRRIALNLVVGISPAEQAGYGDFLGHDERYARCREFLEILRRFWDGQSPVSYHGKYYTIEGAELGLGYKGGGRPRIYISGASTVAQETALAYADCWLRYGHTPEGIAEAARLVIDGGGGVGVRMHVLARPTREEALAELSQLIENPDERHKSWIRDFVATVDSEAVKSSYRLADQATDEWLSPYIWTGAVPYRGGPALCVVGSYEEVAEYIYSYKSVGVSEFIFSGWPTRDEMRIFFTHVLPIIRNLESQEKEREKVHTA